MSRNDFLKRVKKKKIIKINYIITTICPHGKPVFRRTQSGKQHADVRGPGHRVAGHDRAASGRRGRRSGAETWPAEGRAAAVQAGHARGAQAAVHQHEAPEERVQDGRRVVVAVRPERIHVDRWHRHRRRRRWHRWRPRRGSHRTRVRGQRQLVRVPRAVQAASVRQESRLRADHVPVQEGRVGVDHQQEQRIHR